jgi:hypothetical protein
MALIKTIDTGLYRIPLTVSLSDSTHGKISAFELVLAVSAIPTGPKVLATLTLSAAMAARLPTRSGGKFPS